MPAVVEWAIFGLASYSSWLVARRSVGRTLATDTVRSPRGGGTQVMINMLPKLEWAVLLEAATDVGEWATAARPQPLALGPAQLRWLACEQRAPPLRAAGQATLVGQHI